MPIMSYQKTAPGLRSYIRFLCNDAALADDFLQESFYRFLRSAASALNDFQMKSYLYKTASSLIADHWSVMGIRHLILVLLLTQLSSSDRAAVESTDRQSNRLDSSASIPGSFVSARVRRR